MKPDWLRLGALGPDGLRVKLESLAIFQSLIDLKVTVHTNICLQRYRLCLVPALLDQIDEPCLDLGPDLDLKYL